MKRPFDMNREYDPNLDLQIGKVRLVGFHFAFAVATVIMVLTMLFVIGMIGFAIYRLVTG